MLLSSTSLCLTPLWIYLFQSKVDIHFKNCANFDRFESYAGQVVSSDFLSAIKMVLDNASSNAVNPHFIKLFDLIEKSLDDAKVSNIDSYKYKWLLTRC
jgi:hypothetical protein